MQLLFKVLLLALYFFCLFLSFLKSLFSPLSFELSLKPFSKLFLAPKGAQEMQMFICLSEAKCSIAHNLNLLGSDYIKMTSGRLQDDFRMRITSGWTSGRLQDGFRMTSEGLQRDFRMTSG